MSRILLGCLTAGLILCAGCAEQNQLRRSMAQPYQPTNRHQSASQLPQNLRRIAVLPLTADEKDASAQAGCTTLEPILLAELRKRAAFELVPVSRDQLRAWTGRVGWRQEELLPAELLAKVQEHTGCEGVLFDHLTVFRPYPPLAVGWRLSLVDCADRTMHWTVDEVFDAGSPEVIKAAQNYFRGQMNQPSAELDSTAVLTSPRRFGQYAAAAAFGTLPTR
jgi:hypothetical protein